MIIKISKYNTELLKKFLLPKNNENLKSIVFEIDFSNQIFTARKVEEEEINFDEWVTEKNIGLLSNLLHQFIRYELREGETDF